MLNEQQVTLEEFEAALEELASASDSIPVLPPEAYTREGIYADEPPGDESLRTNPGYTSKSSSSNSPAL